MIIICINLWASPSPGRSLSSGRAKRGPGGRGRAALLRPPSLRYGVTRSRPLFPRAGGRLRPDGLRSLTHPSAPGFNPGVRRTRGLAATETGGIAASGSAFHGTAGACLRCDRFSGDRPRHTMCRRRGFSCHSYAAVAATTLRKAPCAR